MKYGRRFDYGPTMDLDICRRFERTGRSLVCSDTVSGETKSEPPFRKRNLPDRRVATTQFQKEESARPPSRYDAVSALAKLSRSMENARPLKTSDTVSGETKSEAPFRKGNLPDPRVATTQFQRRRN
ncbi:hypothetical protein QE152_g30539 [Popillia japonica]|uniref:Uncharacterized protein n=1 Tax=Popillia japonica TaxID=7064 RepID=A0AAW1JEF7_POPJA